MTASWLDDATRAGLERKKADLAKQLAELSAFLDAAPAHVDLPLAAPHRAEARETGRQRHAAPVRAYRRKLTKAERAAIGERMRAVWAKRRKAGGV